MSAHSITSRGLAGRKIPQGTLTPIGTLLFSASEPGAWYDPSDLSTLFQDAAGTTPVTAVEQPVGRILDKSGRGNHATQATTTKRPVLSRRVNLFTASEFQNGLTGASPRGGLISASTLPGYSGAVAFARDGLTDSFAYKAITGFSNTPVIFSLVVRMDDGSAPRVGLDAGPLNDFRVIINGTIVLPSQQEIAPGVYRLTASATITSGGSPNFGVVKYSVDSTKTFKVTAYDLRLATDAHLPYQWVNTATDYDADPAKLPAYRRLDGVDDSHASATGGGGTAGFFFSASVTPLGGAGTARTLFSDAGTNTGYIVRLNTSNQLELAAGNGTAYTTIATSGTLAVGTTDIVQAWDDGTNLNVKIGNGATASVARPVVSAGTAGYTMGQDNGASTGYFNGRIHSTIYRKDSGLTQVLRESVALYQRQKARMP